MKRRRLIIAMATLVLVAGRDATRAATNYWDNNGATPGFGVAGGTWGAEPNWSSDGTGASLPAITNTTTADALHFGTASDGLDAGTIAVVGTNQGFRSMTFGAASGAITLSGGTLNLAEVGGKIVANNASNTVGSVLAGSGGLSKFGTLTHTAFLTTNAVTVFPNTALADYVGVDGVIGGAFVGGGGGAAIPGDAYFFNNDGLTATYQLQILDSPWTKCVKIELTQVGPDIRARVLYAKYINNGSVLGYDFDAGGNDQTVATSFTAGGYGAAEITLTTDVNYALFLPPAPGSATIVSNVLLSDVLGADGTMGGSSISGLSALADAYYFTNDGAVASYQLQAENGGYTKCVKVELTQAGADITARVLYAKYTQPGNLGYDFDTGGNVNTIVTSYTASGYGAATTVLNTFDESDVLILTGVNTYAGSTTIGGGPLEIGGAGQLGGGSYTGTIVNSGGLLLNSTAHQSLRGAISGTGMLVKGPAATNASFVTHASFLTTTAVSIFPDASLSGFRGADGTLGGASVASGAPFPGEAYHFTNDGSTATFQLQTYEGGHTKCVKVELTQVGPDIAGRALYAKYLLNQDGRGYDFDTGGNVSTIATSYAAGGYGVAEVTLTSHVNSRLSLSAANSYSGGTVVNVGILEVVGDASALPYGDPITVGGGGHLRLHVDGLPYDNWGGVGNGGPITVQKGGRLTLAGRFNAGYGRPIVLDGGLLNSTASDGDNSNYMNDLTLRDGARVTGMSIRVGNFTAATIAVSGAGASSVSAGIRLVNGAAGTRPLTLDVADVTGDAATDLAVAGVIWDFPGYTGMPIIKAGPGTVTFSGTNSYVGLTTVTNGTLALGAHEALDADNNIVLVGGTLDMGTFNNTLGTLTVATNSVITLGAGQLAFAESSALPWTGNLALVGALGPHTVRFGDDGGALTGEQLARITLDDAPVFIDAAGYLGTAAGTVLIIK